MVVGKKLTKKKKRREEQRHCGDQDKWHPNKTFGVTRRVKEKNQRPQGNERKVGDGETDRSLKLGSSIVVVIDVERMREV